MRFRSFWLVLVGGAFALLALLLLVLAAVPGDGFKAQCVGVVRLAGDVAYDAGGAFSGGASGVRDFLSLVASAENDRRVVALLIEVNSPGGSAAASKEAFDALRALEKPSVAYVEDIAASGGYYVASAATEVVANPLSLTGSLGARASILNYEGLFEKLGLREETFKSGALKDLGSGTRNLTDDEREILQGLVDELATAFERDVRASRGSRLTPAFEKALDARILTASQARAAGLVDAVGTRPLALNRAWALANRTGEPEACAFERRRSLVDVLSSLGAAFGAGVRAGVLPRAGAVLA